MQISWIGFIGILAFLILEAEARDAFYIKILLVFELLFVNYFQIVADFVTAV
jgi:hypothetical protein